MDQEPIPKTILVDAIDGLINRDGTVFEEMHDLLEEYPNDKIILTSANDEQFDTFNLHQAPYEVFTLKHDPEKTDPQYYRTMLAHYGLRAADVVYFEHSEEAVASAQSVEIVTHFYDHEERDLEKLKDFLNREVTSKGISK